MKISMFFKETIRALGRSLITPHSKLYSDALESSTNSSSTSSDRKLPKIKGTVMFLQSRDMVMMVFTYEEYANFLDAMKDYGVGIRMDKQ